METLKSFYSPQEGTYGGTLKAGFTISMLPKFRAKNVLYKFENFRIRKGRLRDHSAASFDFLAFSSA